jgi:hypothetical protein
VNYVNSDDKGKTNHITTLKINEDEILNKYAPKQPVHQPNQSQWRSISNRFKKPRP